MKLKNNESFSNLTLREAINNIINDKSLLYDEGVMRENSHNDGLNMWPIHKAILESFLEVLA